MNDYRGPMGIFEGYGEFDEPQGPFVIKHRRTGMFVARQKLAKSASRRMPCANWRWVRNREDAEQFAEKRMLIYPLIQIGCEHSADCFDANGQRVKP